MEIKTFDLKYGRGTMTLKIPARNVLGVLETQAVPAVPDEKEAVVEAVRNPTGSPPLSELVKKGDSVVVIASDITRNVRNPVVIPTILEELRESGIPYEDITVVVATGTHRGHTRQELEFMFGREVLERVRVVDHNCRDRESLVYLGVTSRGTPVWVNRLVAEADKVIITGGIVYHSMAGFGGGRKAVCPGVSGYETIQYNHKLMLNPLDRGGGLNPCVGPGRVCDNPMAQDMAEIAAMVNPTFMVNVILNGEGKIARVVAGDYREAFEEGCREAREFFSLEVEIPADALFLSCGGFPRDIDLYQATKAVENCQGVLKDGGVIVLLAECPEGVGHADFYRIIKDFPTRRQREEELWREFSIAKGVGYMLTLTLERFRVVLVSKLDTGMVSEMGMVPAAGTSQVLEILSNMLGYDFKAYVVPAASTAVPVLVG
ncbi:nickel-dependent lactate racemase [Thermosediminibacter litoriperuensis]|uniref:Nickel-dependent lactate racemase n=1 Tax=Thermosediminibacter litoriperuensis TaxID=291989 RepID=A0A5S5AYL5_9FIRM|nr:nickel-dependent lactate racemase [Thermosediminibacter litoriperuensis]TYP57454.1 nickel-dependent lactate racemase [Thermosediminibacter litoriperuensis]